MKRPWLAPLVPLYAAGVALRNLRLRRGWEPVRSLAYPVLSVGNLSAGGAGKTPLTIALARLLMQRGFRIDVLSRGYGRRSTQPLCVDPTGSVEDFGDEPIFIARAGVPVYVAPKRYDAGLLAEKNAAVQYDSTSGHNPSAHILDDGFQHRQLARDIDILLLNREDWQDTLLPAGNLREPLRAAARAHVLVIPVGDPTLEADLRARGLNAPIWHLRRQMNVPTCDGPVAAFCGIARPAQFFAGLEAQGLKLVLRRAFPDHFRYTASDLNKLAHEARAGGATALISTEKDAVRIGTLTQTEPALPLLAATLEVHIDNEDEVANWLSERLSAASQSHPV